MNVIKLGGVGLAPEVFGDKILKRNTWNGTGYEHAEYTVLRRPIPPWARERMGPSLIEKEYPNIKTVNDLFAAAAGKASVQSLHAAGMNHKKFLKYRAKFIGKYVKNRGAISINDILPSSRGYAPAPQAISHIEF